MAGIADDDILRYCHPARFWFPFSLTVLESCLVGDMIKVYVGRKSKRYAVHKTLLTKHKWFREKIFYRYSDLSRDSINLCEEDPQVFELLITWLYGRKLKKISTTDEDLAKKEAALYINAYLSACEWAIYDLQNALMDRLRVRQTCEYGYFPQQAIKYIYANTESDSPLRSYIVDSFIHKGIEWNGNLPDLINSNVALTRTRALQKQLDAGNQAFALDCYEALFQLCAKSKIRDPDKKTGCVYHKHMEGEHCRL